MVSELGPEGKGVAAVVARAFGYAVAYTTTLASACGPLDVGMRTTCALEALAGKAGGAPRAPVTFLNQAVLLLWLRDRHHGWRPAGILGKLDHRPHELLWAESEKTLTWAEMGSLLLAREQRLRSLLGATVGQGGSVPGLKGPGAGRKSWEMDLEGGIGLAWS